MGDPLAPGVCRSMIPILPFKLRFGLSLLVVISLSAPMVSAADTLTSLPKNLLAPKGGVRVILAYSSECPISNEYSPTLKDLVKSLPKGAEVTGLSVDYDLTDGEVTRHLKEHGLSFGLVRDRDGSIVRKLGVKMTPEAVVLDDSGQIRYRGRIDDQFIDRGKRNAHPETHDLLDAVKSVLASKEVATPWPPAIGCPIPEFVEVAKVVPVYTKDVQPILQKHCQMCHREGEVAPFRLETYEQARKRAADLANVVSDRRMPPWKATHGFGPVYNYDKSLSDAEIEIISRWADGGAPKGNDSDAPAPLTYSEGWKLGEPDLILDIGADYEVPATGDDVYRCFVIPTNLGKDVYVRAAEVRPGNRRVVHHVLSYVDVSGQARAKDEKEPGPGYTCYGGPGVEVHSGLFGWAPGNEAQFLPEGVGISLPNKADTIVQLHYHPNGKVEKDRTRVGLYLAKTPIKQGMHVAFAANFKMELPAGDSKSEVKAYWKTPVDVTVLNATPHMHQIGKDMAMSFILPDKQVKQLVKIDDWDFGWQLTYWFKNPLDVPKGSVLEVVSHYDNSASNPRNPNKPPKPMHWGEATTDEMCIGFVALVKTGQDLTKPGEKDDLGEIMMRERVEAQRKFQEEAKRRAEARSKK
jgi:peroxiredoxin